MVKTFKSIPHQNQKSYDLETWHVALSTQALQSYINDDPGLTLTKVYINGQGHMTKMAARPIYGKTLKMSCDLETWHVASGNQALQSLYK